MRWRLLGSSIAGTLHADRGLGCDDAHGWAAGADITVAAIADGAGSRPGTSAVGAHLAVSAVLDRAAEERFADERGDDLGEVAAALVTAAVAALHAHADATAVPVDRFATTLCVAVLGLDGSAGVAQIGDGIAVVERATGAIETVATADRFEYVNQTAFATAGDALDQLKTFSAGADDPVTSVALSTDGLRYKVLDDVVASVPFEPFFRDGWAYAARPDASSAAIASFLREVDDQSGDDKTLVLAVSAFDGAEGEPRQLSPAPQQPAPAPAAAEPPPVETSGDVER